MKFDIITNHALVWVFIVIISCTSKTETAQKLDIQGHRGARGLLPENSIPAFIKALELGVTTLELDLAVSKEGELIVSHEPYMSSSICLDPDANEISKEEEFNHNIFQMTYEEIKQYDCGSKGNTRFPDQKKSKIYKPRLIEVIEAVNEYVSNNNASAPRYNMEIKSDPKGDSLFHPVPSEFSDIVYDFITKNMDVDQVTVQSFDFRVLKYIKGSYPEIELAALVENKEGVDVNLNRLGFNPDIYSCDFTLLDEEAVIALHNKNIKVIPWTVNEISDMERLVNWGVDGLITDYPDRASRLMKK